VHNIPLTRLQRSYCISDRDITKQTVRFVYTRCSLEALLRTIFTKYQSIKQNEKYPLSSNGQSVLAHQPSTSPPCPSSVLYRLSTSRIWPAVNPTVTVHSIIAHSMTAHCSSQAALQQSQKFINQPTELRPCSKFSRR